jgi:type I site-specific restriction-modification system R (restriction) subunit
MSAYLLALIVGQTFPYALQVVQELAATEGKRFAAIADEAHSSQTGEAAAKLKQLLSADEAADQGPARQQILREIRRPMSLA